MAFRLLGLEFSREGISLAHGKRNAYSENYPMLNGPVSTTDVARWQWLTSSYSDTVTEQGAMSLSAVYGCVKVLSETFAALPVNVLKDTERGAKTDKDHPAHYLLKERPNEYLSSYHFRQTIMVHKLLWGNAYARIKRDDLDRPTAFVLYNPTEVSLMSYQGTYYYKTPEGDVAYRNMLHFKNLGFTGMIGKSTIRQQAESLGVDLNGQRFIKNFYNKGASLSGVLLFPSRLSQTARERIQSQFDATASGIENAGATAVLEEGVSYQRLGVPPAEAQFVEQRRFSKEEIATMFRVPLPMIGDLTNAHYSNVEQLDLQFVKHTMIPHIVEFEQEVNAKCFSERERGKKYCKVSVNGLLRGDLNARKEFYRDMIQNGVFTANDVLALEDMNTYEGGEKHWIQMNMMSVEDYTPPVPEPATNTTPVNDNNNEG